MNPIASRSISSVAFIGNHTPRQCGIATFTADLADAVAQTGIRPMVMAMNDQPEGYAYPDVVSFEIDQHDPDAYLRAAEHLNRAEPDAICLQHEYGIFGGEAGEDVLKLLREVHAPIVTTLHTILRDPDAKQREVMDEIIQLSEFVVTMTERGARMLEEEHRVQSKKICVVPHGIPCIDRVDPEASRRELGFEGRRVLFTFGLLGPDKGIESVIRALPRVVEAHPEVLYVVLGATHPHIVKQHGQAYRESLAALARECGVEDHVRFENRFATLDELTQYLHAADIYITPYLKREQITSGTLAYAFGCGKAVISTPYWHAEELLADGRGILVPFRDSDAISREILGLLDDPARLRRMQARAFEEGKATQWDQIGHRYAALFEAAKAAARAPRTLVSSAPVPAKPAPSRLPKIELRRLVAMTDDVGIVQHAKYHIPNRHEGYCTDDNARAAMLMVRIEKIAAFSDEAQRLGSIYQAFLHHALGSSTARFRNFMGYDRTWLEDVGSEDSHGRALWSLGEIASRSVHPDSRAWAEEALRNGARASLTHSSPRAWAFSLLGMVEVPHQHETSIALHARKLHQLFKKTADSKWQWFENVISYDNARLPQALLAASEVLNDSQMKDDALTALRWLVGVQSNSKGVFVPAGTRVWFRRDESRDCFDQQPIEAWATVEACAEAYRATSDRWWLREASRAFQWFFGRNLLGANMIDSSTGGCYDGLTPEGPNRNQGAESLLAWLGSLILAHELGLEVGEPVRKAELR